MMTIKNSLHNCRTLGFALAAGLSLLPVYAQTGLTLDPAAAPMAPAAAAPMAPAAAAPGTPIVAPGAPIAVTPDYRIAPGDVISVNIADWPNNSAQAAVAPDGTISMPLIRQVSVAGLTIAQAETVLVNKWKKYIIDPSVTVSLNQKHPQFVVFSGSVSRPGPLEYRPGLHLIEALAEIGGFVITGSPSAGAASIGGQNTIADPSHVTLTHADGTKQALNLTHQETLAGTPSDVLLEPGDVIYVPQQLGKINVVGQVHAPGVIPYRDNLTVFDAISDTGGYNDGSADLENATLTHNGKTTPINLDPMLRKGDMHANVTLAPGDQISIPEISYRTVVFGDVNRPGAFIYKPGYRISDALSSVSGPTGQADLSKINIIRTDAVHKTQQLVRVNFNDFVLRGKDDGNPLIQPGDSLYIPDKHHTFGAQDILNAASGVGSLVYTGRVLNGH